ncbi:hypothetical protein TrCOL_g12991 [Triparma columacea]|uniref:ABC1 atypical kinase-like domain-containing protein n=1 Tax=Triparma columacea TaxID=722753 RepID=A0A9W7L9J8_9STRA|nr:hypothetical protein TrCOL_g12991 [Triparma columacea]
MKELTPGALDKSYISYSSNEAKFDSDGLPTVYDADLISIYWKREKSALNDRWLEFVRLSVPFLTRLTTLFITEGASNMGKHVGPLARQAREIMQELGPTFVKAGQMMSVRPDVLPDEALEELAILQDSVIPFSTPVAISQIESELGGPLSSFFTSISDTPVASASLAQVYKAVTLDGRTVAVKVQRPNVLSQVSKDLYVLRRAAEVYQGLIDRFAPQQRTDYVALLNEFAVGFYTELDFLNEGRNQERMRNLLKDKGVEGVMVPEFYQELSTRRILVSEWVDGVKLSTCPTEEVKTLTPLAQEAFLVQLLEVGLFHADPHPGNILKLNSPGPSGERLALIDFGLVAEIKPEDRDLFVQAIIHLANRDYAQLVDDFINLKILPDDCDRVKVIPLMDKALSPYIKGGGAKKYEQELRNTYGMDESMVGGFQAMTQDALTVLNDIPFSIPAYFAILGRAIVTLEGVALTGDPNYAIIMQSYPFIARKLLKEDRPVIQRALQDLLYSTPGDVGGGGGVKLSRLLSLINSAAGLEAEGTGGMIDLDADFGDDGLDVTSAVKYVMSTTGESLRSVLKSEAATISDLVFRNVVRKSVGEITKALPQPPKQIGFLFPRPPDPNTLTLPFILPGFKIKLLKVSEFIDVIAPKLTQDEELYTLTIGDAVSDTLGPDVEKLIRGEGQISLNSARLIFDIVRDGGLAKVVDVGGVIDGDSLDDIVGRLGNLLGGSGAVGEKLSHMEASLSEHEKDNFVEFRREVLENLVTNIENRVEMAGV